MVVMNNSARLGIVAALVVVVGVTLALKRKNQASPLAADPPQTQVNPEVPPAEADRSQSRSNAQDQFAEATTGQDATAAKKLPRLVDLGAGKCIPCKKMAPILEALKKEYAGRFDVEFIDVWENPRAGNLYRIRMIPTQIFYDSSGKELFRHEGFYGREDILNKWKELGVDFGA